MFKRVVVVGGFSESADALSPLAEKATNSNYSIADNSEIFPLGDALSQSQKLSKALKGRGVVALTHSAGIIALSHVDPVQPVETIMCLNGPEPTSLSDTINRAMKIAFAKNVKTEPGIEACGLVNQAIEIIHHPIKNLSVPLAVRYFSTVTAVTQDTERFPGDRFIFQTSGDEFGFVTPGRMQEARQAGVHADIIRGTHNDALLQPEFILRQIHDSMMQNFR